MLIPVTTLPALLLPAMSVAAALVTLWLAPSPEAETSAGQLATPEPAVPSARAGSAQVKPTTTSPRYQPAAFLPAGSASVTTGGWRSILMPPTEPVPLLPALSRMSAEAPSLLPSPVMVLLAGWVPGSMPDSPSSPVHAMETSPLYQPAVASVVGAPIRVGAVLSMLMSPTVLE